MKQLTNTELKKEYLETLENYYHFGYICIHYSLLAYEKEMKKRNIKF